MDFINRAIEEFIKQQREYNERTLAEIIANYDFMVGSIELKEKLANILPKDAKIAYTPYIDDPSVVYAIKKFNLADIDCQIPILPSSFVNHIYNRFLFI